MDGMEAVYVDLDLTYRVLTSFEASRTVFFPLQLTVTNNILFRASKYTKHFFLNQAFFFVKPILKEGEA